ncbi:MAG: hypothetical protein ACTHU0_08045 [Kofleriaceae bacterium]
MAEELKAQHIHSCKQLRTAQDPGAAPAEPGAAPAEPGAAPAEPGAAPAVAEMVEGACTRERSKTELRNRGARFDKPAIEAAFAKCFEARVRGCQSALDADIDEGIGCWKKDPWPELPPGVAADDVANTNMCLVELKVVMEDLRRCASKKKQAEQDACVAPYLGYSPQCKMLSTERVWKASPGFAALDRVASADAKRKAEQEAKAAKAKAEQEAKAAKLKAEEEAKIAKETERCFGRSTLEFAERLKANPGPRNVPGCKYQVAGRVVSRNNVFVQLVDPTGSLIHLLRTREVFDLGTAIADRTATFDTIEQAEMEDGTTRPFAVFKLDPLPKTKPAPKR